MWNLPGGKTTWSSSPLCANRFFFFLLNLLKTSTEKEQKEILGSAVKALATGVHTTETVQLGRVGGGHVIPVTVGKLEEKKQRATDHHGNLQKNRG